MPLDHRALFMSEGLFHFPRLVCFCHNPKPLFPLLKTRASFPLIKKLYRKTKSAKKREEVEKLTKITKEDEHKRYEKSSFQLEG